MKRSRYVAVATVTGLLATLGAAAATSTTATAAPPEPSNHTQATFVGERAATDCQRTIDIGPADARHRRRARRR